MHEELRQHLGAKAKDIRVSVPDRLPEKAPGGRAAMGAAALAMALVLGVGIGVPLLSGEDGGTTRITEIAASDTTRPAETTTSTTIDVPPPTGSDISRPGELPAVIEGPRLVWQEAEFEGHFVQLMVQYRGTIYGLGDSVNAGEQSLFTSQDGLSWSATGMGNVLGDNSYVSHLRAGDHGLVAVGRSFEEIGGQYAVGSERTLIWTSADGEQWAEVELVADLPAPESKYLTWTTYSTGLAISDGTVVAFGSAYRDLDYEAVEADFFPDGLPHSISFEGDGLYDYSSGPPAMLLDADELGIPDGRPLWEQPSLIVGWVARDGYDFESIDLTGIAGEGYIDSLVSTPSGFAALGSSGGSDHEAGEPVLFTSFDGVSWVAQQIAIEDPVMIYALQAWGDRLVAVGADRVGRSTLYISNDGGTLNAVGGPAFETGDGRALQMYQVAAGPLGLVTFGETFQFQEPSDLTVRSGGRHMIIDQTAYPDPVVTIIDDVSGEVIFEGEIPNEEIYRFSGDAFTATIEDPESGELLFEYTADDLNSAQAEMEPFFDDFSQPSMALLYTTDGERWNRESFDDLFGFNGYGQAVVMEDRVVLVLEREFGGTRMYVGTLEG